MKNIYKQHAQAYIDRGYSVIPDKYMQKQPAIKEWSKYCYEKPTQNEINSWFTNFEESNIAICLGESSGVVCLDIDTTDSRILDIILPLLPPSPVEKKGAKGFTRFYQYKGEVTETFKHNGEMIIELLSSNKKTTIPPSVHPTGQQYEWSGNYTLLDIKSTDLPVIPPFLMAHIADCIRAAIPDTEIISRGKTVSGRNDSLSKLCGKLIMEKTPIDTAIKKLVEFDRENNEVALFSDPNEFPHTEEFTNALLFYSNHLSTANSKHYRKNEEYEIPVTASAIGAKEQEILGKHEGVRNSRSKELHTAPNASKTCLYSTILGRNL